MTKSNQVVSEKKNTIELLLSPTPQTFCLKNKMCLWVEILKMLIHAYIKYWHPRIVKIKLYFINFIKINEYTKQNKIRFLK